jgi:hypothetical protein
MRIVRTVIATCLFVGLAAGASLAGPGSGSGAGAAKAAGAGSGSAAKAPAMEMPKPPAELADMQKKMVGSWKCTGKAGGPDGQMHDTAGTLQFSVDLDKWWSKASLTETGTKTPYKFEAFTSYDAASKKWVEVSIDNVGGYSVSTSSDMSSWTGSATAMGHTVQTKSTRTHVSDKDEKIEDSMSMDNGKTWVPTVAVECKK